MGRLQLFVYIYFPIALAVISLFAPYKLYKGLTIISYGEATRRDRMRGLIPFYSEIASEKMYTGKVSKILITNLLVILSIVFRAVVIELKIKDLYVNVASVVFILVTILLAYLSRVILVFKILYDQGELTIPAILGRSIIFQLGYVYIGDWLPAYMTQEDEEEYEDGEL